MDKPYSVEKVYVLTSGPNSNVVIDLPHFEIVGPKMTRIIEILDRSEI